MLSAELLPKVPEGIALYRYPDRWYQACAHDACLGLAGLHVFSTPVMQSGAALLEIGDES